MKIAIYNRYWNTRGGGERYAGAMAEILSQKCQVELLGPEAVDLTGLADHLGLDLSRLRFRRLPPVSERELAPLTAEYDLLINCTYLSRLPSQAKKSLYLVLFPQKTWPPFVVRAARVLARALQPGPSPIMALKGFHEVDGSGSHWSRGQARLMLQPSVFQAGEARIRFLPATPWTLAEALLEVRSAGHRWRVDGDELVLHAGERLVTEPLEIELRCRTFSPRNLGQSEDSRELGVCLAARPSRFKILVRSFGTRLGGRIDGHDAAIPAHYDLLVAISEFTREWVRKRWKQSSEVLTPPVDTSLFRAPAPSEKRKVLLSVGRFFAGSHNKKHLQMLRVFRGMVDRGEVPEGWEYHLVGNLHRGRLVHLEYYAELEHLAEGYPVRLRTDLSLDQLVLEYQQAALFWHAAGWGENERAQPEKFEHFGITTCEAMSAGCIPVVIAKAGQLEIVEHGRSGFLFHTSGELASITRRLMEGYGEPWTRELMLHATTSVQRFALGMFEERLWEILEAHDLLN